jgi:hypothetical protein
MFQIKGTVGHVLKIYCGCGQCFGSGSVSVLDPDSIGSVDPDPCSESVSRFRRAKMTHKSRKKLRNFMF